MDIERRYATGSGPSTPPGPVALPGERARLEDRRQGAAATALAKNQGPAPAGEVRPGDLFRVKPAGRRGGEHVCGVLFGVEGGWAAALAAAVAAVVLLV